MDFDSDEDWTEATDLNLAFDKRQVNSRYSATSSKASHGKYENTQVKLRKVNQGTKFLQRIVDQKNVIVKSILQLP